MNTTPSPIAEDIANAAEYQLWQDCLRLGRVHARKTWESCTANLVCHLCK